MNPISGSAGVSTINDGITRYKPVFVPRSNPGSPQLGPARRIQQQAPQAQPHLLPQQEEPQRSALVFGHDTDSKFDDQASESSRLPSINSPFIPFQGLQQRSI